MQRRTAPALALLVTATVLVGATSGRAAAQSRFSDTDGSVHAEAIDLIAAEGITSGFPDGTYRPRGDVRRDQMATFLTEALDLQRQAPDFPDVPKESVHYGAIGALAASNITTGFTDGTYRPLAYVTRGQMATFLATGLGLPPASRSFPDVPSGYVHADSIAALAAAGISEGFSDGTFRPNQLVKRDQMASFLVRGLGLVTCPPHTPQASAATTSSTEQQTTEADDEVLDRGSEDLAELRLGEAVTSSSTSTSAAAADNLGPAVEDAFPVASAVRVGRNIEVHSFDLDPSRSARVDTSDGDKVKHNLTIPAGRRTWATTNVGNTVFVGQWGAGDSANLYSYRADQSPTQATAVAGVPSGGEFWSLTADGNGRLWAGTRAHASGDFRRSIGLGTRGYEDNRHVVHRIDPSSRGLANVLFEAPCLPTLATGLRPDVKQVAAVGGTLYVGLGQQTGGARLYAMEPGNRTDIPQRDVRHLTPDSVANATGIFALRANTRHVAFGTQGSTGIPARMVVLDAQTGDVRVDIPLSGENRVDAIALNGSRVAASTQSGRLFEAPIPTSGVKRSVDSTHPAPVPAHFSRYIEFNGSGLRGITNQGFIWTRTSEGNVTARDLDSLNADGGPGQPQSIHAGATEIAAGANSSVSLRPLDDPQENTRRRVEIAGEAKALTSNPGGDTFAATYSPAALLRIPSGTETAQQLTQWDQRFFRPADIAYDSRPSPDLAHVVARDDNNPSVGTANGVDVQFRASNLFPLSATGESSEAAKRGIELTSADKESRVEATTVAVPGGSGSTVYIGDTFGGVQAVEVNPTDATGSQSWYRTLGGSNARRIVSLEVVDGLIVAVASGSPVGKSTTEATIVYELEAATGAVVQTRQLGTPDGGSGTVSLVGDAASRGSRTLLARGSDVLDLDRLSGNLKVVADHDTSEAFGGPYITLDPDTDRCDVYGFSARDLFRAQLLPDCSDGILP